jgi:preprotein translocase subunit SecG
MQVLNIFHVLIAIALIAFVLIQKGQGATAGAAFGAGASGTVFGSRGAGNFLSKTTWILAALFCTISLTMAVMVSRIMSDPEVGLGVVGDTAPAVEESIRTEPSVLPQESEATDVPAMDAPASDLPAVDTAPAEEAANDVPPVEENDGEG